MAQVAHSGYVRELSVRGIGEFVNIKTVWIKDEDKSTRNRSGRRSKCTPNVNRVRGAFLNDPINQWAQD